MLQINFGRNDDNMIAGRVQHDIVLSIVGHIFRDIEIAYAS